VPWDIGVLHAATSAYLVSGSETGRSSAVDVSDADEIDRAAANAALRDDSERIALISILPSIRNGSLVTPDAVCTGTEPKRVTL
jgi:hypothetical protein